MRVLVRSLFIIALAGFGIGAMEGTAMAQEAEIFEVNDFVDPGLLAPLSDETTVAGYFGVRFDVGFVSDYQSRFAFTDEDRAVGQLTAYLLSGRWQVGFEALSTLDEYLDTSSADRLPEQERFTVEVAYYFRTRTYVPARTDSSAEVENGPVEHGGENTDNPETGMLEGESPESSTAIDQYNRLRVGVENQVLESGETLWGLNLDWDVTFSWLPGLLSGWHYTLLQASEGDLGRRSHYLSVSSQGVIKRIRHGELVFGLAYGGERTRGHTKFSSVRLEVIGRLAIPTLGSHLQIAWAPAWQPQNRDHPAGWNQEISILFRHAVFSKLFSRARTSRR